jgi:hypothetical protein
VLIGEDELQIRLASVSRPFEKASISSLRARREGNYLLGGTAAAVMLIYVLTNNSAKKNVPTNHSKINEPGSE